MPIEQTRTNTDRNIGSNVCTLFLYGLVNSAASMGAFFPLGLGIFARNAFDHSLAQQGCNPSQPYLSCTDSQLNQANEVAIEVYLHFLSYCALAGAAFGLVQGAIDIIDKKRRARVNPDTAGFPDDESPVILRIMNFYTSVAIAAMFGNLIGYYLIGEDVARSVRDHYVSSKGCSDGVLCPSIFDEATKKGQHALVVTTAITSAVTTTVGGAFSFISNLGSVVKPCIDRLRRNRREEADLRDGYTPV